MFHEISKHFDRRRIFRLSNVVLFILVDQISDEFEVIKLILVSAARTETGPRAIRWCSCIPPPVQLMGFAIFLAHPRLRVEWNFRPGGGPVEGWAIRQYQGGGSLL